MGPLGRFPSGRSTRWAVAHRYLRMHPGMKAGWSWLQAAFLWQILAMAVLLGVVLVCRKLEARRPTCRSRQRAAWVAVGLFGICMATILLSVLYNLGYPMRQGFVVLNGRTALRMPPHSHGRVARRGWREATDARLIVGSASQELGSLEQGLYAVNASGDTWIEGGVEGWMPVAEELKNRLACHYSTPRLQGPGCHRLSERLGDAMVDFGGTLIEGRDGNARGSATFRVAWGWVSKPHALRALPLREPHGFAAWVILTAPLLAAGALVLQARRVAVRKARNPQ